LFVVGKYSDRKGCCWKISRSRNVVVSKQIVLTFEFQKKLSYNWSFKTNGVPKQIEFQKQMELIKGSGGA
jgi:hypothetical protein